MKIKQLSAILLSICGLNVGIAKSVAGQMKAPVLAQQSGKIEEAESSIPEFQNLFPYKVADKDNKQKDRGGNPERDSTAPGGARGIRGRKCNPNDKKPFLVVTPVNQETMATLASHPTFWLYIPRSGNINFVLQDKIEGDKIIYETKFNVASEPGFISWKLPSSSPPLDIDSVYNWEFTFDCGDDLLVIVEGIIFREEATDSLISELESAETVIDKIDVYQENDLWPESVNELVNLRRKNPDDPKIKDKFKILLGNKWYDDLVYDPIQDCCQIGKKE
ncbi:DUF928 domain-containing protein [Dapis sp. BLCC M126]|uniref:DUF928 domain-containing protein n=1 Tax=Dapis sp. BLCC M126 TaxID=3400189 RepID=UPI003CEBF7DD